MTHEIRGVDVEKYAYYVNKLRQNVGLETWKWCQIVTSQTVHTKWPPNDPEPKPFPWKFSGYATDYRTFATQRFSIHFEARTPPGKKNHFCTPCAIWCIVFCIIRELRTPRSPFSYHLGVRAPQLRAAVLDRHRFLPYRMKSTLSVDISATTV